MMKSILIIPRSGILIVALVVISLCAVMSCAVAQEEGILDKSQSWLDGAVKSIKKLGEKASEFVDPGWSSDSVEERTISKQCPVSPEPSLYVSNQFGEVRVTNWEEQIIHIVAQVSVSADKAKYAKAAADALVIDIQENQNQVQVRTIWPDPTDAATKASITVNYEIKAPRDTTVAVDNFFGDIAVRGVEGPVTVDSKFCKVTLSHLRGPVHLRSRGEMPVQVMQVQEGGIFDMEGAKAEFSAVGGRVQVRHFRGELNMSALARDTQVEVTAEDCPVRLRLFEEYAPDIKATVSYGTLHSPLPLQQRSQANHIIGRLANAEARQQIDIRATFCDVYIEHDEEESGEPGSSRANLKAFNDVIHQQESVADAMALEVRAAKGNVYIEGSEDDQLYVEATRAVWTDSATSAPAALEVLSLSVQREEDKFVIVTSAPGDMDLYGCGDWRINLRIRCPKSMPLDLHTVQGLTTIEGLEQGARVNQGIGGVTARQIKGALEITTQSGGADITSCEGPVTVSTRNGDIQCNDIGGVLKTRCVEGQTIIEHPRGPITVRNQNGDVRILALEGIGGDYDVLVEEGSLSLLVSPEADAAFTVRAYNGVVDSAINLDGKINREVHEYYGRLKDGARQVRLETRNGDIILD